MPFTAGLALGGWLADRWNWRMLFYVNVPLALAIAGFTGSLLLGVRSGRETSASISSGFLLLAVIFMGLQTILNEGNDVDWFDDPWLRSLLLFVIATCAHLDRVGTGRALAGGGPAPVSASKFCDRPHLSYGRLHVRPGTARPLRRAASSLDGIFLVPGRHGLRSYGPPWVPLIVVMHEVAKRLDVRFLASLNAAGFAATFYWIGLFDDPQSYDQIFSPMVVEGIFLGSFFTPDGLDTAWPVR